MQNNAGPRRSCSGSDKKMEPQTQRERGVLNPISHSKSKFKCFMFFHFILMVTLVTIQIL